MRRTRIAAAVLGSLALLTLAAAPAGALPGVTATHETPPNFDDDEGGNADADDPAIWVNPDDPGRSVVVGTLKNGGLAVFDLRGRQVQHIDTPPAPTPDAEPGRFNNVDIVQGARIGGRTLDLAVVSDRGRDRIRVFAIDRRGHLTDVTTATPPRAFSATEAEVDEQRTAYGLTVAPDPAGGAPWVVASRRHETRLGVFRLADDGRGRITYRRVDTVDLPASFRVDGGTWSPCAEPGERPQVEGMVFDPADGVLYAAQEDVGVWRVPVRSGRFGEPSLVERVREFGRPAAYDETTEECAFTGPPSPAAGRYLTADAEGLAIARGAHGEKLLLASSQGDSTFAAYRVTRHGLRHTGGFAVADGPAADGVQHSDGAAVTTTPLGREFPHGLLVVHDGENTPGERESTNFKLVRWERVAGAIG
ncbi:phytase [Actinokineospora sp. NBRC 105648]|uniref:phytase n=1 Tax=Actinokineospora sp. NBRC 105648 TaxID=3032206 RepID=UPI0024A2B2FD|nr:phytase [Actinokineospora sp. NBRC 105648]GLZ36887.1 hydrolase [Actinokineospora sp. NBRC 105648]